MKNLDSEANVALIVKVLIGLCVLLFLVDLFYHRHTYVPGEGFPGFYAILGFIAFTCVVLGSKLLRTFIKRDESFYSPYSVDAEEYPNEGLEKLEDTAYKEQER